jgi:hypothetical protein
MSRPLPVAAIVKGICWFIGIVVAIQFFRGCADAFNSTGNSPVPDTSTPAGTPCPARITASLPEGGAAELVVAYRTIDKQIVVCRTSSGTLYYHGEYTATPNEAIVIPATTTPGGYLAHNGVYEYEIAGPEVIVRKSGQEIGRQTLMSWTSPS